MKNLLFKSSNEGQSPNPRPAKWAELPRETREILEAIEETVPGVAEDLFNCPEAGDGVNPWCFQSAIRLCLYFQDDAIEEILTTLISEARPRDIKRAVENARRCFEGGPNNRPAPSPKAKIRFGYVDKLARSRGKGAFERVKGWSFAKVDDFDAEKVIDRLYPWSPLLLSIASHQRHSRTHPRDNIRGAEASLPFIVPSPMSAITGISKEGRISPRCLNNTGPRVYLVVDLDIKRGGQWDPYIDKWEKLGLSTLDVQSVIIQILATEGFPTMPPVLVVYSGNGSLHVWYWVANLHDEQIFPFMARAISLGADPVTWRKCQLVRMPGGLRDGKTRQSIVYFNPSLIAGQPLLSNATRTL